MNMEKITKKRFYYAVVSFNDKNKKDVKHMCAATCATNGREGDAGLFPVAQLTVSTEIRYKEFCMPDTVLVENVFEISLKDYQFINKMLNLHGLST